jgi:hypothetical protein
MVVEIVVIQERPESVGVHSPRKRQKSLQDKVVEERRYDEKDKKQVDSSREHSVAKARELRRLTRQFWGARLGLERRRLSGLDGRRERCDV